MSSSKPLTFYDRCRLCLDKAGEYDMFDIEQLARDIFTFTTIKVSIKDNLPTKICKQCMETIYSAKNLRILALRNNTHLLTLFGDEDDNTSELTQNVSNTCNNSNNSSDEVRSTTCENDHGHKRKKKKIAPDDSDQQNQPPQSKGTISVRKDVFKSTPVVSSTDTEMNDSVMSRKRKSKTSVSSFIETELECSVCEKTFETKRKLYIHQRNHNKKMICPLDACGKSFASKGDLEKHLRTHTGVKPYKCEVCDKCFTQHGTLKAHRDTMHGVGSFIIGI